MKATRTQHVGFLDSAKPELDGHPAGDPKAKDVSGVERMGGSPRDALGHVVELPADRVLSPELAGQDKENRMRWE